MALLLGGLLVAIGFGAFVLALLAALLIVIAVVAFVAFWPEMRRHLAAGVRRLRARSCTIAAASLPLWRQTVLHAARGMRAARRSTAVTSVSVCRRATKLAHTAAAALLPLCRQTLIHAERGIRRTCRSSAVTSALVRRRAADLAHIAAASSSSTAGTLIQIAHSTTTRIASRVPQPDPRRKALQLNAAGTRYRREDLYDQAVECHRRALGILRALDDRQAVALTQSNLALALSHAGDDGWAIGLFEEAAAILHELGDEQHEAQIIANLGLAHRRHGRREEGDNVLEVALSKLTPASSEYQAIEAELRRAS